MSKWETVKLIYVCKHIFAGSDVPKDNYSLEKDDTYSIPIYTNGEQNAGLYGYTTKARVNEPSVTVSARGTIGFTAIRNAPFYPAIRLITLTPNNRIDIRYLYYVTQNYKFENGGTSIPQLTVPMLKSFSFPLPPLETQRQIAATLDKATQTIDLCNAILEKLDLLVKARFVEMFGDKEYPYQELISLIIEGAGLSYGIVQPGDDGTGDMGVLRPVDLVDGSIVTDSIKYIDRHIGASFQKTELTGKELLITVRGTTGITALSDERFSGMNVTRGIAVIRYNANLVNPLYLNAYLQSDESQRYIQENTRGATLKQINLSDLRVQKILVPPLNLQQQFAAFVEKTDRTKAAVKQVLAKAETLKKALMQEYFG